MIVSELIEKLKEFPPDMSILFYNDEVGELYPAEWVGEMAGTMDGKENGEIVSGVVIHHFQPSSRDEWIARA